MSAKKKAAAKKPAGKKPAFKLPTFGKSSKKTKPVAKKKEAVPLTVRFQLIAVEDAQDENGIIVRKTVEASGPQNAVLRMEVTDPAHHAMLTQGKYVDATFKEVADA